MDAPKPEFSPRPVPDRPGRRYGIWTRMILAFGVIAAMSVVAGMVAWLSLRRIEGELAGIVGRVVPAMTVAETLAVETAGIANATGALANILSEPQRVALMESLGQRINGLNALLSDLQRFDLDQAAATALQLRVVSLAYNLNHQSELVAQRIAVHQRMRDAAAQLGQSHKAFLAAVTPRIENTYRSLFAGIKTLVTDIVPPGSDGDPAAAGKPALPPPTARDMVVLQQRISRLFNRNVGEMLALLELAAAGNLAAGLLNEAILVGGPVEVQQLRARFTEVTVSMGTIRLNLATTPENQVLLSLTTPMLQFGLGNDNLFDLKLRELEWQAGSEAVVSENLTLSEELTQAVNQMVASAKAAAGQAAMQVRDDAAYSRLIQTLTALLAVLTALLVAWRWVGRGIVGRILVLQRCMEAEAAGQEMVIPASGNDEISAMAGALRQFVARRKQAESDLTAAKERAESAFRELKEVQASLVQAEKMASLAGLVAGVAHEVNTPVGVCVTAASLLAEKTEELAQNFEAGQLRRSKVQEYLSTTREISALMRSNLERAGDLIRMFKQVAVDRPSGERRRFRLFEQLEMVTVSLAEPIRAGGHAVVLECPLELQLEGYAEALRQVVDSLVGNALTHAFEGQGGGKVTISAEEGTPGTVTLTVADNGRGIPADDLSRVFEPFFTTRRNRGGLGLGLHVVFNIVTAVLGGRISVESKPGVGTRFLLLIPTRAPAMQEKTPGFSRT